MGIFGRGNKGKASRDAGVETDAESGQGAGSDEASAPSRPVVSRSRGPFDRSEVDGLDGRLDLGALWLTGVGIVAVSIATPLVSSRIFDKWFTLPNR